MTSQSGTTTGSSISGEIGCSSDASNAFGSGAHTISSRFNAVNDVDWSNRQSAHIGVPGNGNGRKANSGSGYNSGNIAAATAKLTLSTAVEA
ncbi:hypothetical protein [Bifidobacterium sp. ESL0745]|uniref:hypothetical protein n=1 Tax=Bifidobacterium sp. ESL0745 TaxID=2983226 RepID=UPI0023F93F14|nr:hypothetical protein [Bifidobacterium sp. ESL0745]MDF7665891.1 hypothetical protein [Bifidobacterium sp. ESL0745]